MGDNTPRSSRSRMSDKNGHMLQGSSPQTPTAQLHDNSNLPKLYLTSPSEAASSNGTLHGHDGTEMLTLHEVYKNVNNNLLGPPSNVDFVVKHYQDRFGNDETMPKLSAEEIHDLIDEYMTMQMTDLIDVDDLADSPLSGFQSKMESKFNILQKYNLTEQQMDALQSFLRDDVLVHGRGQSSVFIDPQLLVTNHDSRDLGDLFLKQIDEDSLEKSADEMDAMGILPTLDRGKTVHDKIVDNLVNVRSNSLQQRLKLPELHRRESSMLEAEREKDLYASNREPFPLFINVALFARSDDKHLELLIDKAMIKVVYGLDTLWQDRQFVKKIYDDATFANAVEEVYREVNAGLDFISKFVQFSDASCIYLF